MVLLHVHRHAGNTLPFLNSKDQDSFEEMKHPPDRRILSRLIDLVADPGC